MYATPACVQRPGEITAGATVSVTNYGGTSNSVQFTVTTSSIQATTPTLSALSPTSGAIGTSVTLTGTRFSATSNTINFGSNNVIRNIASTNGTSLTFTVPAYTSPACLYATPACVQRPGEITAGAYAVSVTNSGGTSNSVQFAVTTSSIPATFSCSSAGPDGTATTSTSGNFERFAYGVSSTITAVKFAVWSEVNGQDDLSWYEGVKQSDGTTWKATVDLAKLVGTGVANTHVYMEAGARKNIWCDTANFSRTAPPVAPVAACSAGPDGTVITGTSGSFDRFAYNVPSNTTAVNFAVWSAINGQDDIVWYPGVNQSGGTWKAVVDRAKHSGGGLMNTHVYRNTGSQSNIWCDTANFSIKGVVAGSDSVGSLPSCPGDYLLSATGGSFASWNAEALVQARDRAVDFLDRQGYLSTYSSISAGFDGQYAVGNAVYGFTDACNDGVRMTFSGLVSGLDRNRNACNANMNLIACIRGVTPKVQTPTIGKIQGKSFHRVSDNDSRQFPAGIVTVRIDGGSPTTATEYSFDNLSVGTHTVSVTAPTGFVVAGYNTTSQQNGAITAGSSATINVAAGGTANLWWFLKVPVVAVTPVAPTCSSASSSVSTTTATSGTVDIFANGVSSNVTSVTFPTWSDVNGQDDIGSWYQGVNLGGGRWKATIDLARHTGLGGITTHVYLNAPGTTGNGLYCLPTSFTRTAPPVAPVAACSAGPDGTVITGTSGSFDRFAYDVPSNTTAVNFAVWSEVNGQDDLVWYTGVNQGGGTWKAVVDLASHAGGGSISTHVYRNTGSQSNIWCDTANFSRAGMGSSASANTSQKASVSDAKWWQFWR